MTFEGNTDYKVIFKSEVHGISFYAPAQGSDYHMSRYVAAGAQNIYSASGITKELNEKILKQILSITNKERNSDTLKTDIGVLINNLLYRMRYPVDEDCALRMGAIYCFMEGEDPDKVNPVTTERKIALCKGDGTTTHDPDLYTFFLTLGVMYTPAWKELDKDLINTDYFRNRREALNGLTI